jgi:DNA-binding CsgD family transcriptional regulator
LAALEEALMHHQRLPQPFDLGRTLLIEGQIQRRFKKKAAARESFERALRIFEDLGAPLWFARAREELGRIGGRPSATNELTESERRVAELVGEGKTNAEVAALLFMSVHTVRSNLRRIYGKLGIRSRSELGHQLRDPDDTP